MSQKLCAGCDRPIDLRKEQAQSVSGANADGSNLLFCLTCETPREGVATLLDAREDS